MLPGDSKAIFDYLDHEGQFQAAAAAITGAAAAWWLKALLTPARDAAPLRHPLASRIAATLLAASAASFFIERGRIARTCERGASRYRETRPVDHIVSAWGTPCRLVGAACGLRYEPPRRSDHVGCRVVALESSSA